MPDMEALMTRPAPRRAPLFPRLRLSEIGWGRRMLLIVGALVGSAAVAYAANVAGRAALWQVVRACTLDQATTGSPLRESRSAKSAPNARTRDRTAASAARARGPHVSTC